MTKDEARLSVMGAISMALKDSTLQQGFDIICKNLAELEKENAELKEKVAEYSKANKWYYPSKGEYPKDKTEMLIYFKYTDYEYPCKTFGFYNGKFWDTKRGDVSNKELIAWKEIILPKE